MKNSATVPVFACRWYLLHIVHFQFQAAVAFLDILASLVWGCLLLFITHKKGIY